MITTIAEALEGIKLIAVLTLAAIGGTFVSWYILEKYVAPWLEKRWRPRQ